MTRQGRGPVKPVPSSVKCSARNRFDGRVKSVTPGAVNAEVIVALAGALEIVAIVTIGSVRQLRLREGRRVTVLIKAPNVLLATGAIACSARNALAGTVGKVREGLVNGEVRLDLPGGERITAILTNASIRELKLEAGAPATALVMASSVLLAVK